MGRFLLLLLLNEAGEAAANFRRGAINDGCRPLAGVIHIVDAEGLEHAIAHADLLVFGRQRRQDGTLDAAAALVPHLALLLRLDEFLVSLVLVKCRLYTCLTVLRGEATLSLVLQRTRHALIHSSRHLIFKLFDRSAEGTLVLGHGRHGTLKQANADLILDHSLLRSAQRRESSKLLAEGILKVALHECLHWVRMSSDLAVSRHGTTRRSSCNLVRRCLNVFL